jgi:hypothetical protein
MSRERGGVWWEALDIRRAEREPEEGVGMAGAVGAALSAAGGAMTVLSLRRERDEGEREREGKGREAERGERGEIEG